MSMTPLNQDTNQTGQTRTFAVVAVLFAIWGVALWLYNSLFFKFAHFFNFDQFSIPLTLAAFHLVYACFAIPAVLFHRKFGYKLGLLFGLTIFGIGAFLLYLAIVQNSPFYFLGAVLTIGSCGAWLDTSLNPVVALSGAAKSVVTRMNIAHVFNGMGIFIAYFFVVSVLGKDYNFSTSVTAQISARPYVLVGLGAILLAFLIEQVTLPTFASKGTITTQGLQNFKLDFRQLASDRMFVIGALALGCYCAVLTILWTANYRYLHSEMPEHVQSIFERAWFWLVTGRIVGAVLMRWINPLRLLQASAGLCLVAIAVAGLAGGEIGWAALMTGSLFLAVTFPTVYGSVLQGNWTRIAAAAAVLAIVCGIGNALSSLTASLALDAANINPRLVILFALPFETVILYFAVKAAPN